MLSDTLTYIIAIAAIIVISYLIIQWGPSLIGFVIYLIIGILSMVFVLILIIAMIIFIILSLLIGVVALVIASPILVVIKVVETIKSKQNSNKPIRQEEDL